MPDELTEAHTHTRPPHPYFMILHAMGRTEFGLLPLLEAALLSPLRMYVSASVYVGDFAKKFVLRFT